MSSKNYVYVLYNTFNSDLLFWVVVCNLFLSTAKGLSAFDIVHVSVIGLAGFLILYPLINHVIKHSTTKFSIFLGAIFYIVSIIMYMLGESIVIFSIAQIIYFTASSFKQVSTYMLKNNLDKQKRSGEFVKWQSIGRFGYAFITLAITLFAGVLFNVSPYLPTGLALIFAIVGLVFALIYKDEKPFTKDVGETKSINANFKDKLFVLLLLVSVLPMGMYLFMQDKGSLLLQYVSVDGGFTLAQASVLISAMIFIARLVRVIADVWMPHYYEKLKNKSSCLVKSSLLITLSCVCFALGAVVFKNIYVQLTFITIGYVLILFVRDTISTLLNKIVVDNYSGEKQKQMLVSLNILEKFGRLIIYLFALVLLGVTTLNNIYLVFVLFGVAQIFVCVPLSKYLNKKTKRKLKKD